MTFYIGILKAKAEQKKQGQIFNETVRSLAKKADISSGTISKWETGVSHS